MQVCVTAGQGLRESALENIAPQSWRKKISRHKIKSTEDLSCTGNCCQPPLRLRVNIGTLEGRAIIKTAVSTARGLVNQGPKAIPLFQTWKSLKDAAADDDFLSLPKVLETAKNDLAKGLEWHVRQTEDDRLSLKALAAHSFVATGDHDPACPLCASPLDDEKKKALAAELRDLKINSAAAERKIADVCRGIQEVLTAAVPTILRNNRNVIDNMDPATAYSSVVSEKFVTDSPFSDVLTGLAQAAKEAIELQRKALPHFTYADFVSTNSEPAAATKLSDH